MSALDSEQSLVDWGNTPEGFYWELKSERRRQLSTETIRPDCPVCGRSDCPAYLVFRRGC